MVEVASRGEGKFWLGVQAHPVILVLGVLLRSVGQRAPPHTCGLGHIRQPLVHILLAPLE